MAISLKRYIDIVSGIAGGNRLPGRELIGRIYTTSPHLPMDYILELEEAADIATFFGSGSEQYRRGAFYFGFISKMQTRPRKLSFARWAKTDVAPTLRGVFAVPALAAFQAVTDGSFTLTLDGNTHTVAQRDFSAATSYAAVATILESGIRAADSADLWSSATVVYDAARKAFIFTGGAVGACAITPAGDAAEGTPIAAMLRWNAGSGALASAGYDAQSVTDILNKSTDASNNYGTFLFDEELTVEEMEEAASFAHLSNVQHEYCQRVSVENAAGAREALQNYSGVALTEYDPAVADEFPEMAPMLVLASTDYTRRNAVQNYMYQQFNLTPTVTDNTKADLMDALRVNYYGRTQQAGQVIDFYQRGVLQGEIQDMNIYGNEMWLIDRIGVEIMCLKLSLPQVGADASGRGQIAGCLEAVTALAKNNGAIAIDKPFTFTQKAAITQLTGDDLAWVQVQSQGAWYDVKIESYTVDDRVEYKAVYTLIYAKGDAIRKTEGSHSLI